MSANKLVDLGHALDKLNLLAADMQIRSSFRVEFQVFHIMPLSELNDWQSIVREQTGNPDYNLPPELVEIYVLTGGFEFRWTCDSDRGNISGAIVLPSMPELYQLDDEADLPLKECMLRWRRFDDISEDEFTAFRLDVPSNLYYFCPKKRDGTSLGMSPKEYICSAVNNLGTSNWQVRDVTEELKVVRELAAWE